MGGNAPERAGMPPSAASRGAGAYGWGSGVLAPEKPAEGVEVTEHLDLAPPGCSWLVGDPLGVCGSRPITHRLVVVCGCVTLLCPPHVDDLVAFLAEHIDWTLFCAQCGRMELGPRDFRVVPL